jgi:predicted enzyme related to lactoylglutathione lyase
MAILEAHKPGSFCWIELGTTDQAGARAFYGALFGWSVQQMPMGPDDVYDFYQIDGKPAAAGYKLRPEQVAQGVPPNWRLYIAVENVDTSAAHAATLGAKVLGGPFDVYDAGRMALVQDPTGAAFALWQAKRVIPAPTGVPGTMCWADLATRDVPAAKTFYEGLLGWKISASANDASGYLHIQNGEDFIGGIPPSQYMAPDAPAHWLTYFYVADVDASAAQAKELGGSICAGPMSIEKVGRMAFVADPQGAVFALFTPGSH